MPTTYLTVAIPYVNAAPHLGYAYELVQADLHARARRADGYDVRFLGGTDDHALKNVLAAEAAGTPVRAFVDSNARAFAALREALGISFDDFIRTSTDPRHRPAVERLWRACADAGDLYRSAYEGDYCVGCEQFYGADDLEDGCCPEHRAPTERVAEDNWFFRLSRYQDHIESLIASGTLTVHPEAFRDEVLAFVRRGLEDISVSRSARRARGWGIPVPGDPGQVVYVWFDALANYVSALDYGDPASTAHLRWWREADHRVHVVGKGILRFHAVYWPAFLASAGEPAPTRIEVHPYLTVDGAKLSKSSGVKVDPVALTDRFGSDALRWWFARRVGDTHDTDFTVDRLVASADDDLANGLGNATNRLVTLVHRARGGRVPPGAGTGGGDLARRVNEALGRFDHRAATRAVAEAVTALNRDIEASRPWALATREREGDAGAAAELDVVLARQVGAARALAVAVAPVVPGLAAVLERQLAGEVLAPPAPAFARIGSP
jgi:methionyl-tRNA synthetase